MNFTYFTDESEKSLSPFFSPITMSLLFKSVFIVSGILLVFTPWSDFMSFIHRNKVPLLFFELFTATLILHSYINLRCGRGEMVKRRYLDSEYHIIESATFEKENDFFQYGLIEFCLHTLFLMLPFLPLLMFSASISGVSLPAFAKACSIVLTASLLCRMFGFIMYLVRGRKSSFGFLLTRTFLIIFLFGTAAFVPAINPILIIYEMNSSLQRVNTTLHDLGLLVTSSYVVYMATVLSVIVILVIVSQILVRHYMRKEKV
jgi:hypothetical protein